MNRSMNTYNMLAKLAIYKVLRFLIAQKLYLPNLLERDG